MLQNAVIAFAIALPRLHTCSFFIFFILCYKLCSKGYFAHRFYIPRKQKFLNIYTKQKKLLYCFYCHCMH